MSNSEAAIGLAGLALILIPWGLDKIGVQLPPQFYWGVVGIGGLILLVAVGTMIRSIFVPRESDQRPIIDVEAVGIRNLAPGYRTGVTVEFTNRGPVTAYDVLSDVSIAILPRALPKDYPMPSVAKDHASIGMLAANGGRVQGFGQTDQPLTTEQVIAIEEGTTLRLYVAGTLSYRLNSGKRCERHFLMHTGGEELMDALHKFALDKTTKPPFWMGDRFNDETSQCS